ncbi:LacI family DNA-binding transcriptional regulator [Alloacidobacterium dinghuense]|uniref:LacI family DNA-binding transcriptional regulator n=1 Tax=Alloacidobacterium dinghuense TaxID=2763107 RepID=A0A7G8BCI2_9BACT|nr:LacI family DNA-binding transcriptional regulator [Alloacidobacterium dinghuense]QNI30252.1 LacI family DNA-binding transcriptional regulator [Alloacidobacterium dinghuense]
MPKRKSPVMELKKSEFLPGRPISLKILGDYLDLSPATISLVLNNAPGVRSIPQETRDRVLAAAKKFDYRPSFYARSLRRKQSFSVGVLVPELSDGYSVLVMDGIEEVLVEEGYFYLTASHRRKADLIEEYPRLLMDRSVEGFIAIDTALQHSLPLPVIAVAGHKKIEGVTSITLDHKRAAELALHHLYQLGHRQIAFMRGQTFSSDSEDRWNSFMSVARKLGLEVPPELTVQLEVNVSSPELGYPVVQQLLAQNRPFTALVSFNDVAAIGAIRAFRDHGLSVPEDVSIVGFDDIQGAAYHNPSLTTIRQPLHTMGINAARFLLQRIQGLKDYPEHIAIVPELIIRESTCPPKPKRIARKR